MGKQDFYNHRNVVLAYRYVCHDNVKMWLFPTPILIHFTHQQWNINEGIQIIIFKLSTLPILIITVVFVLIVLNNSPKCNLLNCNNIFNGCFSPLLLSNRSNESSQQDLIHSIHSIEQSSQCMNIQVDQLHTFHRHTL